MTGAVNSYLRSPHSFPVNLRRSRLVLIALFATSLMLKSQPSGFTQAMEGEVLRYWSPLHEFADSSLLTRANGHSPIRFAAETNPKTKGPVTFRFLIGHSTGTSSGERDFDVSLNGLHLFTFHTLPHMETGAIIRGENKKAGVRYLFRCTEQDINRDAFGFLEITLNRNPGPKAEFGITGRDYNSRDWLMVFKYREGWKLKAEPTALVLRSESKRMVNFSADVPGHEKVLMEIRTSAGHFRKKTDPGYQTFSIPVYPENFTGTDTLQILVNGIPREKKVVELSAIRPYRFHIIHHSHNDIGYSHEQEEVARIQSRNISDAMHWIDAAARRGHRAYWHIESLWAAENFLNSADEFSKRELFRHIRNGNIVLSANYANVLTGLCQPEELRWMTEYARHLEKSAGIRIKNAMITDIPGISYWGLKSYTDSHLPYLSLGPNYVENLPDRGDRVGGVINETGDQAFFWKPDSTCKDSLLVWTAGKGYSYFHNIAERDRTFRWEKKISDYVLELSARSHPFEDIQLRYTKNADNGPVDTTLDIFVEQWNEKYSSPQLILTSVDSLFQKMIADHRQDIPVRTGGEIAPYWEDGAYSTAREEIDNRLLSRKTINLEQWTRRNALHDSAEWYPLHRDVIMFHEHTWGSWCSISDPELPFTKHQWEFKKNFLDSGMLRYAVLKKKYTGPEDGKAEDDVKNKLSMSGLKIDSRSGGIGSLMIGGEPAEWKEGPYRPFQLIYSEGTGHPVLTTPTILETRLLREDSLRSEWLVKGTMTYFPEIEIRYSMDKKNRVLEAAFKLRKTRNDKKESLHIALPFQSTRMTYGTADDQLMYPRDLLAGSNFEFVCTPELLRLQNDRHVLCVSSAGLALAETGGMIDEGQVRGAKVWKRSPPASTDLFLYVLNNYWHTNYKAYQEGDISFSIQIHAERP